MGGADDLVGEVAGILGKLSSNLITPTEARRLLLRILGLLLYRSIAKPSTLGALMGAFRLSVGKSPSMLVSAAIEPLL